MSTPQTVSIAVGAVLVTVVDYRLLVLVTCLVTAGCCAYLLTRRASVSVSAEDEAALAA